MQSKMVSSWTQVAPLGAQSRLSHAPLPAISAADKTLIRRNLFDSCPGGGEIDALIRQDEEQKIEQLNKRYNLILEGSGEECNQQISANIDSLSEKTKSHFSKERNLSASPYKRQQSIKVGFRIRKTNNVNSNVPNQKNNKNNHNNNNNNNNSNRNHSEADSRSTEIGADGANKNRSSN